MIRYFCARHAALNRLTARVGHGIYKGRCIWRNGHQLRWAETVLAKDGR